MSQPNTLPSFVVHTEDAPSVKGGSMPATATGILELHIDSSSVRLYPTPRQIDVDADAIASMALTAESLSRPFLCLLSGPVDDFQRYSRQEASQWLIDMAHDICDPAGKRGSLLVWKELQQQWFHVAPTDPLTASIYRYDIPNGIAIGLSKISEHNMSSRSSTTGNAATMRDRVRERDQKCWITDRPADESINSHIIPKRIGDYVARIIYQTFTGSAPDPALSIFHPIFGLSLAEALDMYFDRYQLGFRFVSQGRYECHYFREPRAGLLATIFGTQPDDGRFVLYALHGAPAIPPNPAHMDVPPPGLFRWHYLQCVIKKFGHPDYKTLQNIKHYELPFRTTEESDDDYSTESNEDWPSKALDLGRAVENTVAEREERHRSTAQWISTV